MVGTVGTRHTFGRGPFWDEFETWANNEPDKKYSECIDNIDVIINFIIILFDSSSNPPLFILILALIKIKINDYIYWDKI